MLPFIPMLFSNILALNEKEFLIDSRNIPPSTPAMEESKLFITPLIRIFLIATVTWVAGKILQTVCTVSENCEIGIYAPITNPAAAESIPKKALDDWEVLNRGIMVMKKPVADTDPRMTIP